MRLHLVAAAALSAVAVSLGAPAQTDPAMAGSSSTTTTTTSTAAPHADPTAMGNAAMKDSHPQNAGPLAAGANSFTKGQAIKHIEHSGFTGVTDLTQDENGVWHGKAMKGGQTFNVALDFKGNVVTN